MSLRLTTSICVSLLIASSAAPLRAGQVVIKIATVAPRGSMWMRLMDKMKAKILKETGGAVKLHYFPGQVQGDERDVVRKMRTGQLQGGAFTAIGLSLINPKALVLQMPRIVRDQQHFDRMRKELHDLFARSFIEKGYVLLGWAELGPIHIFSDRSIKSLSELRKQKVWVWTDDAIAKALMRELKISPRQLGLPQVLPAMNTGIINTVYNSPLGLLAVQWHSKTRFLSEKPFAIGVGATVITKKSFDKLSSEQQKKLLEISFKYHEAMIKRSRKDNLRAAKALLGNFKFKAMKLAAKDEQAFNAAAEKVAKSFVPRYFPKALLDKVRAVK